MSDDSRVRRGIQSTKALEAILVGEKSKAIATTNRLLSQRLTATNPNYAVSLTASLKT
jgi:hypothetical protein